jgi:hypothetical protein
MAMMGNERSGAQPFLVASVFLGEVWMGIGVRPPFFFFLSSIDSRNASVFLVSAA